VRPMRVQDREVKGEDRERRLLLAKIEPPDFAVGTWRRVGGQGVLFHRKGQGLRANRVRRRCGKALAIVSKTQRLIPQLWVPRG